MADKNVSLDELLGEYTVYEPGDRENMPEETQKAWPDGYWAFADDEGINAFFGEEKDAFAWRLFRINMRLNDFRRS